MKSSRTRNSISLMIVMCIILSFAACAPAKPAVKVGIVRSNQSLEPVVQGFKDGLKNRGYVEGKSINYIDNGVIPASSVEAEIQNMVDQRADLILALGTTTALTAKKITEGTNIPVVFAPVNDPLSAGLVNSLSQPGGNLTGIKVGGFVPKQLEWLIRAVPRTRQLFAPYNPGDSSSLEDIQALNNAAQKFGIKIISPQINTSDEVPAAIAQMPDNIDGIILMTDALILSNFDDFVQAAAIKKIPLVAINKSQADAGALLTYGPEFFNLGQQCARLADQILKGVKPASLPVEQADFYLTVNAKVANSISVKLPSDLLKAADAIIR